jgi:hypothetical protein
MTIDVCKPDTWPCPPLLALRRKQTEAPGTAISEDGKPPLSVVHADCATVRADLDAGRDPRKIHPGAGVMHCSEILWDWEVDPQQANCC